MPQEGLIKSLARRAFDGFTLPVCGLPRVGKVLRRMGYQHKRALRHAAEQKLKEAGLYGDDVQQGPFKGLKYLPGDAYASCRFEKIIGAYEHELHPWFAELTSTRRYSTIFNIGAAEGFYTAGLARLFPDARVLSYESQEEERTYCRSLLDLNQVTARVEMHSTCTLESLRALQPAGPVLVLMDIDLGELLLLDPVQIPWLNQADILVETHECLPGGEGSNQILIDRFKGSHDIRQVTSSGLRYADYPLLRPLLFEEIHALVADDRRGLQDWLLMTPKALA